MRHYGSDISSKTLVNVIAGAETAALVQYVTLIGCLCAEYPSSLTFPDDTICKITGMSARDDDASYAFPREVIFGEIEEMTASKDELPKYRKQTYQGHNSYI